MRLKRGVEDWADGVAIGGLSMSDALGLNSESIHQALEAARQVVNSDALRMAQGTIEQQAIEMSRQLFPREIGEIRRALEMEREPMLPGDGEDLRRALDADRLTRESFATTAQRAVEEALTSSALDTLRSSIGFDLSSELLALRGASLAELTNAHMRDLSAELRAAGVMGSLFDDVDSVLTPIARFPRARDERNGNVNASSDEEKTSASLRAEDAPVTPLSAPVESDARSTSPALPVRAEFLLRLFLRKQDRDAILGDLAEEWSINVTKFGVRQANVLYWADVVRSLWPVVTTRIWSLITAIQRWVA